MLRIFGLLVCLCPLALLSAQGQAWPQPRGDGYFKLSYSFTTASERYTVAGDRQAYIDGVEGDAFFDRSIYLYGEYGLTSAVTLVGLLPYKRLEVRDLTLDYAAGGLGTVMVGARVGLKRLLGLDPASRHALAAHVLLSLPAGYARNRAPSLGSGQVDAQVGLGYGASLYPLPLYVQANVGYRHRSSLYGLSHAEDCTIGDDPECTADPMPDFGDEWLFSAEAGGTPVRWLFVQVLAQSIWSIQTPETDFSAENPFPTRQRFVKVGAGVTLYVAPQAGISLQYFATPYGRSTIRSTDIFLGVEYLLR